MSAKNDKQVEIVSSTPGLKKNWEQTLEGSLMFGASLDDNILVVVSTDFAAMFGGNNSTYKATVLDSENGKVITERMIYMGDDDYLTISEFIVSKDKKSFSLLARETNTKRNFKFAQGAADALWITKTIQNNTNTIRRFSVSTYNTDLETIDSLLPIIPYGDFIGATKTINNDLYIAVSEEKKGVTLSKYDAGEEIPSTAIFEPYTSGFSGERKRYNFLNLIADTQRNNTVYLTGAYAINEESIFIFNKYDFASNTRVGFRKSWKKADFQALEKSLTLMDKQSSALELGNVSGLQLLSVGFFNDNYLVALGDVRYLPAIPGNMLPATYTANGILVYNLDTNLIEKSVSAIPRIYGNLATPAFRSFIRNNSWYLFASDDWKARFTIAEVNALSGKVERLQKIAPEKAGKGQVPELAEMAISDNQLILPVKDVKMSLGNKRMYDIHLYQMSW